MLWLYHIFTNTNELNKSSRIFFAQPMKINFAHTHKEPKKKSVDHHFPIRQTISIRRLGLGLYALQDSNRFRYILKWQRRWKTVGRTKPIHINSNSIHRSASGFAVCHTDIFAIYFLSVEHKMLTKIRLFLVDDFVRALSHIHPPHRFTSYTTPMPPEKKRIESHRIGKKTSPIGKLVYILGKCIWSSYSNSWIRYITNTPMLVSRTQPTKRVHITRIIQWLYIHDIPFSFYILNTHWSESLRIVYWLSVTLKSNPTVLRLCPFLLVLVKRIWLLVILFLCVFPLTVGFSLYTGLFYIWMRVFCIFCYISNTLWILQIDVAVFYPSRMNCSSWHAIKKIAISFCKALREGRDCTKPLWLCAKEIISHKVHRDRLSQTNN